MLTISALPPLPLALLAAVLVKKPGLAHDQLLPAAALRVERVRASARNIAAYRRFFGFAAPLPLAWLYLPAQRAQLALMNRPDFPLRAAGLIHVSNRMSWVGALDATQPFAMEVAIGAQSSRRSGRQFVLETRVLQAGQLVATVASSYLARAPRAERAARSAERTEPAVAGEPLGEVAIGALLGPRYARLSGDWNPIHLHAWVARPFGVKAPIAHGMCMAAHTLAALEARRGQVAREFSVDFTAPMPLASRAGLIALPATAADAASAVLRIEARSALTLSARF